MKLTKKQIRSNRKAIVVARKRSEQSKRDKWAYSHSKFWESFTTSNSRFILPLICSEDLPTGVGTLVKRFRREGSISAVNQILEAHPSPLDISSDKIINVFKSLP